MKIAGMVFSARKVGNGFNCMKYCLDKLGDEGCETMLINAFDYEIKPCGHCNYECYSNEIRGKLARCPVRDDIPQIYVSIRDKDFLLFAVPNYAGHVAGLYKAWVERLPHIPDAFQNFNDFRDKFLSKILGFIVIGNLSCMGDMTLHEVLADFYNTRPPIATLLQADEYGRDSLKGDLIQVPAVKNNLDRFVKLLVERMEKTRAAQ
jgi:multimeric flavodoxin WrbA